MNVLVLAPYLYDTAPGQRFRIEQWARVLEPMGAKFEFASFESQELRALWRANGHYAGKLRELLRCTGRRVREVMAIGKEWDVLFLHRELLPAGPPLLERVLAEKGIPIVYDFDDAIFLPDVSDAHRRFRWLKCSWKTGTICRLSAHVIVGNRYLGDYALRHTPRVSVVPSTIDTERYAPKDSVAITGQPVIGWSGVRSNVKDLRTVAPALSALRRSVDFRLKVVGGDGVACAGVAVECKSWNADSEVEDLQSFTVGIMPLPDDVWSRGKCGGKALQYMAVGVPTVVSPVGVNAEIITDGQNGFIARSEREWVEKLGLLLSDEELRRRFAAEGRRTVERWYSAKVQAPRVLEIFERVLRRTAVRGGWGQDPKDAGSGGC